jgi:hypothetical protein
MLQRKILYSLYRLHQIQDRRAVTAKERRLKKPWRTLERPYSYALKIPKLKERKFRSLPNSS